MRRGVSVWSESYSPFDDEPSDAAVEECREEWITYLAEEYCERCSWTADDRDAVSCPAPCADCAADTSVKPYSLDEWSERWHDDKQHEAEQARAEAIADSRYARRTGDYD